MGWVFSLIFATLLSGDMSDLSAAEAECLLRPPSADLGCVVVRASDLKDLKRGAAGGGYEVALASGCVGVSVGREEVARLLLTLVAVTEHDGTALSIGGRVDGSLGGPAKAPAALAAPTGAAAPPCSPHV